MFAIRALRKIVANTGIALTLSFTGNFGKVLDLRRRGMPAPDNIKLCIKPLS